MVSEESEYELISLNVPGHLLVTTREHKVKVADMGAVESREMGKFFSPFSLSDTQFRSTSSKTVRQYQQS